MSREGEFGSVFGVGVQAAVQAAGSVCAFAWFVGAVEVAGVVSNPTAATFGSDENEKGLRRTRKSFSFS